MDQNNSVNINDKKHPLANEEDDSEEVAAKKAKSEKLRIANDVLQTIIECVPLRNLPNVNMANRRFWHYCDENLEERKYRIRKLLLKKVLGTQDQLEVERIKIENGAYVYSTHSFRNSNNELISFTRPALETVAVPFPEVEPPQNFALDQIRMDQNVGDEGMNFLRTSSRLYRYATFSCECLKVYEERNFKFFDVFDMCYDITLVYIHGEHADQFFARQAVLNCNRINIRWESGSDVNWIFDFLHHPPTVCPDASRQLLFNDENMNISINEVNPLLIRIKKRFMEDEQKCAFVLRLGFEGGQDLEHFQMENELTDEVMFTDLDHGIFVLIRCTKGEEQKEKEGYFPAKGQIRPGPLIRMSLY